MGAGLSSCVSTKTLLGWVRAGSGERRDVGHRHEPGRIFLHCQVIRLDYKEFEYSEYIPGHYKETIVKVD